MNTDIQAHVGHRLMLWSVPSVYCKDCDLFLQWPRCLIVETTLQVLTYDRYAQEV